MLFLICWSEYIITDTVMQKLVKNYSGYFVYINSSFQLLVVLATLSLRSYYFHIIAVL